MEWGFRRVRSWSAGLAIIASAFGSWAYGQPDVVTGYVGSCEQLGRVGPIGSGTVGLGMWTTSCNPGTATAHWYQLPDTDHPCIEQNMYRLRTVNGSERFEQIGQAWLKHGFGSSNTNECELGCSGGPFDELTPNCSDTYAAGQIEPCAHNSTNGLMAPRSMLHPYKGTMPVGSNLGSGGGCDNNYPAANHLGHVHDPISHRLQVKDVDLMSPGARYFGEGAYLVPHEYRAANGNQNNNVSYQELGVFGPDPDGMFFFGDFSGTFISQPAINAWSSAQRTKIEPSPLNDGLGILAYHATNLGGGVWHYEYAIYNMNLNLAIGRFTVPLRPGLIISNIGFHAPENHAPELNAENYSNDAWTVTLNAISITWEVTPAGGGLSPNAIRYGTLYNFRFDANAAPRNVYATVELFKNGLDLPVGTVAPSLTAGFQDCNGNGIDDRCDLNCALAGCNVPGCGTKQDCDGTSVPDDCEQDCNGNGRADQCDLLFGTALDCSGNGIPDECENDCDLDTEADICQILAGAGDCNVNGVLDPCDISSGTSQDADGDGLPDECGPICPASSPAQPEMILNAQGGPVESAKNRYLSFLAGDAGRPQAIRLTYLSLPPPWDIYNGTKIWVGAPEEGCEAAAIGLGGACPPAAQTFAVATLTCAEPHYTDWSSFGAIQILDASIVPGGAYGLQVIDRDCPLEEAHFSTLAVLSSPRWGNLAGPYSSANQVWTAPEASGAVGITTDVVAVLEKFGNRPNAPGKTRCDVEPPTPDLKINFPDVVRVLDAFRGASFPFTPTGGPCGP